MTMKIAAICDNELSGKLLKEASSKVGMILNYEVQNDEDIINKLSDDVIQNSNIILFVTDKEVEQILDIERFLDREYYEVSPKFVIENADNVISEITLDIN